LISQEKSISTFGDGKSESDYININGIIVGILEAKQRNIKIEIFNLENSKTINCKN